jgi:hypothetical protein
LAAVGGIEHLGQAVAAKSCVDSDLGRGLGMIVAGQDSEIGFIGRHRHGCAAEGVDDRQGGYLGLEVAREVIDLWRGSLGLDHHAGGIVTDETCEVVLPGQAVHEGAEADTLDLAGEVPPLAYSLRSCGVGALRYHDKRIKRSSIVSLLRVLVKA